MMLHHGKEIYLWRKSPAMQVCFVVLLIFATTFSSLLWAESHQHATGQQAYIKASNTSPYDAFGISIAISGDTLVVGADGEDSSAIGIDGDQGNDSGPGSGAVYVFVRNGTQWSQQAYIKASNTNSGDSFGISVDVSGDTLVVGAIGEDSNATGVNGDQANNSAADSGAVYVFKRNGTEWIQQAYIKSSNTQENDYFGLEVAISGDTLVVGGRYEDSSATGVDGDQNDNSAQDAGAVYVFTRDAEVWSQQAYIKASNTEAGDAFGRSVAISGDTLVVGSAEDSNATGINGNQSDNSANAAGAVYVFNRNGALWSQQAYIKASNTNERDLFGYSVAISGDTLVATAPVEGSAATGVNGDQSDNSLVNAGAAYVFTRSDTAWSQQAYLKASNTDDRDVFGWSAGISGDLVVVGSEREDGATTGINGDETDNSLTDAGAAYVFNRSGTTWSQREYVKASNTGYLDYFGWLVAVSDGTVIVSATGEESNATGVNGNQIDNSVPNAGAVYVYSPNIQFNAGLNDAWFNPETDGQGFFITVFPDLGVVSLAWFTYDTELPAEDETANLGDPGHRWLTAVGPFDGNQAVMEIEMTSGGLFDAASIIERTDPPGSDGSIILTFDSCSSGTIEYDIPSINRQGSVPITRVANDNIVTCEALSTD